MKFKILIVGEFIDNYVRWLLIYFNILDKEY